MNWKKGFRQFVIRTAVFLGVIFILMFVIFLFFSKTPFFKENLAIPGVFYFQILQGLSKQNFINSAIFVVVAFLLWRRKEILEFKDYRQNVKETAIFGVLALAAFFSHYAFKYWIAGNLTLALKYTLLITLAKLGLNALFAVFLAFSVYNSRFIMDFLRKFYLDIGFFTAMMFAYYKVIDWFQDSWLFFSSTVGRILAFVFSKIFDDVTFSVSNAQGPILGVGDFRVGISKVCSGIDSLLFFISLFAILVVLNWKDMDKKRMALLFVPGLIGTFLLNIIRVFLLIVIAVKISPEFAVDTFHTNAGWILFLGYFITFWHFGSKWVMKK